MKTVQFDLYQIWLSNLFQNSNMFILLRQTLTSTTESPNVIAHCRLSTASATTVIGIASIVAC